MQIKYIERKIPYTGGELHSLFIYRHFDLQGDALISFQGRCKVNLDNMVDQEDVKANAPIYSPLMLHFLGEFFQDDLEKTVLRQRLLIAIILDILKENAPLVPWRREGDDIFAARKKVSVSIATKTPVSTVLHAGLNIMTKGTPVPAFGLSQAKLDPARVGMDALARFKKEYESISLACCKVRGVQ